MFQVQAIRNKADQDYYRLARAVEQRVDTGVRKIWGEYLSVPQNSDLPIEYYKIVRHALYTRIGFKEVTYEFLHELMSEAKQVLKQMAHQDVNDHSRPSNAHGR